VRSLVIDAGNTRVHWRLRLENGSILEDHGSLDDPLSELVSSLSAEDHVGQVAVSCLRSEHRTLIEPVIQNRSSNPILWIENGAAAQVSVETEFPQKTGADRALAALAWGQVGAGVPAVIIDAGTAVTVDAVSAEGVLLGGWISAGWQSMCNALGNSAPDLPKNIGKAPIADGWALDTEGALGGGLEIFYREGIAGLHSRVCNGLVQRYDLSPQTILTGGDALLLEEVFTDARLIPGLVLDGLEAALSMETER